MFERLTELRVALAWLTRLPVGRLPDPSPSLARAVWAFPLVGMVLGLLVGVPYWLLFAAGTDALLAAVLAVGLLVWLCGGLHEDGLADFADAAGGQTRERRLEIMRDSRLGSYGAMALVLVLMLRVAALASFGMTGAGVFALFAMAALSRSGMALALWVMPPARKDGLGRGAGRPGAPAVALALVIGGLALWPGMALLTGFTGWATAILVATLATLACGAAQFWVGWRAWRLLGGQTGDVLGAIQLAGEAAGLIVLSVCAALLAGG